MRAVESAGNSPERLEEGVDKVVEIAVAFPHRLDLADRVNDRRVMLAAEAPADLGKRCVRELLAQIHRDLAGDCDRFRVVP